MTAQRISEFDTWQPGYGGAIVTVYISDTTSLASLYTDIDLTTPASNPQTLDSQTVDSQNYGKFHAPLYTANPYRLAIDSGEETGIQRPSLTTLVGQDASGAVVTADGGSQANTLSSIVARAVHAEDYGEVVTTGVSPSTNSTTLAAAIGAAGANGGGEVVLPPGIIALNPFTLPTGVVVVGQGENATTLRIQTTDPAAILGGDNCGFKDLTLDGVSLASGSIGVKSRNKDGTIFDNVMLTGFVTGLDVNGGLNNHWGKLSIDGCTNGAKLHGDSADGGDFFRHNSWESGVVANCTTLGIELSYEDAECAHVSFGKVEFNTNTGTALKVNGARQVKLDGAWFTGNTINLSVLDDTATVADNPNHVYGFVAENCDFNGGAINLTGTLQDVAFRRTKFDTVTFTLSTPVSNAVVLQDCLEIDVTVSGDGTKLVRSYTNFNGASAGITTGNTATKAWSIALEPGEVVILEASVVARQRNGTGRAAYVYRVGAYRPGSALAYDTQTANFTLGDVLTGATSGATGRIIADADGGATGTLTLSEISGAFIDNEIITGSTTGSATVNGTLTSANASLDTVGLTAARTAYETNANTAFAFVANGTEIEGQVTGDTSQTWVWSVFVTVESV
jgi:hypothetical protein